MTHLVNNEKRRRPWGIEYNWLMFKLSYVITILQVVLGAFLHDIGHLLPASADEHMYTDGIQLGVARHDQRGFEFLKALPLPSVVADLALGHVNAKRYLCYKESTYHKSKSSLFLLQIDISIELIYKPKPSKSQYSSTIDFMQ